MTLDFNKAGTKRKVENDVELCIYLKHDANVTIFNEKGLLHYIELEKVTQVRYQSFSENNNEFIRQWEEWIMPLLSNFSVTKVHWNWITSDQLNVLKDFFPDCKNWQEHTHHLSHAWSLYNFTKPYPDDIIISCDGRGDLADSFKIYRYLSDGSIALLRDVNLRLGVGYRMLGILSPEIDAERSFDFGQNLSVPGKAMALAAYGKIREEWIPAIRRYYSDFRNFSDPSINIDILQNEIGVSGIPVEIEAGRDILATSQKVFEDLFIENISTLIQSDSVKRILLTGGCALNVILNSKISKRFSKEVFVSPVSGDCGIGLGMYRSINQFAPIIDAYCGIEFEMNMGNTMGLSVQECTIDLLASKLAEGKIIGVIFGSCEAGPRALGHRSLLASPFISGIRERINKVKGREFYRPVSPIVPVEFIDYFFESNDLSPFMSFAPIVRHQYRSLLSEVTHIDGSSRVQSVTESDEFIYELITAFAKYAMFPVLSNTSLNKKGRPLVNDFQSAINLLYETEIDFIWINGLLYNKKNDTILA